jgi:hypothetical protein
MCPTCEPEQANGTNGASTSNGNHEGFTGVTTRNNPRPDHVSPYKPVGDFLSNVSRFKIIGTSPAALFATIGAVCAMQLSTAIAMTSNDKESALTETLHREHTP